jgi:hypothetical protein
MEKQLSDQQLQQLQQLLAALSQQLDQAQVQVISNALLACGRLRLLATQLFAALEHQPEQHQRLLSTATGQSVANMALACGHLGHRDQLLMAALYGELSSFRGDVEVA